MSNVITEFEKKIAEYAGAKYGVSVSSASNAIFLCLQYLKKVEGWIDGTKIILPKRTYLSVPMAVKNAGFNIHWSNMRWKGAYPLKPTRIYDSATKFCKDMYIPGTLYVVSFQYRKHLPIGRGGMVLTDDLEVARWLAMAKFNGKHLGVDRFKDEFEILGWDMYMTPEQCARGLSLLPTMLKHKPICGSYKDYPDLSHQRVFNE